MSHKLPDLSWLEYDTGEWELLKNVSRSSYWASRASDCWRNVPRKRTEKGEAE